MLITFMPSLSFFIPLLGVVRLTKIKKEGERWRETASVPVDTGRKDEMWINKNARNKENLRIAKTGEKYTIKNYIK